MIQPILVSHIGEDPRMLHIDRTEEVFQRSIKQICSYVAQASDVS